MPHSPKRDLIKSGYAFIILAVCLITVFGTACIVYYYFVVCPNWESFRTKKEKHLRNAKNWILCRKARVVERENPSTGIGPAPSTNPVFDVPTSNFDGLGMIEARIAVRDSE